jgi:anthranilate synthase component 1
LRPAPGNFSAASPSLTQEAHAERVRRAQQYIASGDVYQLVLASRFEGRHALAPFEAYRAERNGISTMNMVARTYSTNL